MKANLYVFHGSQKTTCYNEMVSFGNTLMKESPVLSEIAFLAHDTNTMMDQVRVLKNLGATEICLKPILLMPAVHFNLDLPPVVKEAKEIGVTLKIAKTLGESKALSNSLKASLNTIPLKEKTCCVILAHGSKKFPEVEKRLKKIMATLPHNMPLFDSYLLSQEKDLQLNQRLQSLKKEYDHLYVIPFFIFYGHLLEKITGITTENQGILLPNVSLDNVKDALKEITC